MVGPTFYPSKQTPSGSTESKIPREREGECLSVALTVTSHGRLLILPVIDLETLALSFKDSSQIAVKILSRTTSLLSLGVEL